MLVVCVCVGWCCQVQPVQSPLSWDGKQSFRGSLESFNDTICWTDLSRARDPHTVFVSVIVPNCY